MKTSKLNTNIISFEDVKKKDSFGALDNYISIKEAKDSQLIPSGYHELFKNNCECGSENIISTNLKNMKCCNPRCIIKEGYMLSEMLRRFGIKNWGPSICIDIMNYLIVNNISNTHIVFFALDEYTQNKLFTDNKKIEYKNIINYIFSKQYTISELISNLGLPNLDKDSEKIFGSYQSASDITKEIETNGIEPFLAEKGVQNKSTAFYINEFIKDISYAEYLFKNNIRTQGIIKIELVITGILYPYGNKVTKQEYIEMLNNASITENGVKLYEFIMTNKKQSAPYVIADYVSNTEKYRAGRERGVLCTSTELLDKVKEVVKDVRR